MAILGHGTCIVETGTDVSGEPVCSSFKVEWDMTVTELMTQAAGISETLYASPVKNSPSHSQRPLS